jgi:acetyl-CoA synthetase
MPTAEPSHGSIESVLKEARTFAPPAAFSARAHLKSMAEYEALRARAEAAPEEFWAEIARREIEWFTPFERVLEWKPPFARWFDGGELNLSYNCLDRHLTGPHRDRAALIWEGEPGERRVLTYKDLHAEVCKLSNVLASLGVGRGDRVAIYMGMVPELAVALLACARIGATHTVVFGGFSAESLVGRINDAQAKLVITQDGAFRRGKVVPLKQNVDDALARTPSVQACVVLRRAGNEITMVAGRDHDYQALMDRASPQRDPERLPSEHPLFILYTSGTTGKPKGVVHTTGGYAVGATYTTRMVFDLRDEDIYFCTADIGWVTGHSYVVYGPLSCGATSVMYEGAPDYPAPDRLWSIIEKLGVTIFYTAPTAIRAFIRQGDEHPKRHDLSSLRLLGTVGEPINPEAWMWYHRVIGGERCPIVDTWWQTETGSIMMSPLPGATPTKPGSCTRPLPGIAADVVTRDGKSCGPNQGGFLVLKRPWPSMLRTIYGDPERYEKQYFSEIPGGIYFTGDGARRDEDGYFWVMGRVDDVVNVAGHRLGTAEVESALVSHPDVAEAAVVGRPDELKGQALVAFVTLRKGRGSTRAAKDALAAHVAAEIGAIARPDEIRFTEALPKTRSGKIMRRLLKELASSGKVAGDVTTLEDLNVLTRLSQALDEE